MFETKDCSKGEKKSCGTKDTTSNCGYFCCQFLIDRFRGKSFAEASGFDDRIKINDSEHREKEIEKLKNQKPFSYIFV